MLHNPRCFFILGCSRSGTTLLASVLNAHPGIVIPPETWWLPTVQYIGRSQIDADRWYRILIGRIHRYMKASPDPAVTNFCHGFLKKHPTFRGHYSDLLRVFASELCAVKEAVVFGEKTPSHTTFMTELNTSFPDFRKIVLLRDPRDIVCSYFNSFLRPGDANLVRVLLTIKMYLYNLLNCVEGEALTVRYENLTEHPDHESTRILDFLGLDRASATNPMIEPIITAKGAHINISKSPFPNAGKYRSELAPRHVAIVETILRLENQQMGYPLQHSSSELQGLRLPHCFGNFNETHMAHLNQEAVDKLSRSWTPTPMIRRLRLAAQHYMLD